LQCTLTTLFLPTVKTTEISREYRFEAAHRLAQLPQTHKCHRLHGHSFRVTVRVHGEIDAQLGWIIDFADIDSAWEPLHKILDHQYLNEIEGLENPTSEILAHWIFDRIQVQGATLHSITVHETCTATCTVLGNEP
jgi:6-pyruvoyltetrahydropterin/6-carboxytetrahydropterin synthase